MPPSPAIRAASEPGSGRICPGELRPRRSIGSGRAFRPGRRAGPRDTRCSGYADDAWNPGYASQSGDSPNSRRAPSAGRSRDAALSRLRRACSWAKFEV
jgi:hypothetical protein